MALGNFKLLRSASGQLFKKHVAKRHSILFKHFKIFFFFPKSNITVTNLSNANNHEHSEEISVATIHNYIRFVTMVDQNK